MDFEDLGLVDWEHHLPPPAAKAVVESLPRTVISSAKADLKCPVCLLEFEAEETVIEMSEGARLQFPLPASRLWVVGP